MNNLGKFAISRGILDHFLDVLMYDLFSKVLILNAEYSPELDAYLYMGYSKELFKPIDLDKEKIPFYALEIDYGTGNFKANRIDE